MRYFLLIATLCIFQKSYAQYAPQYPIAGNGAISKTDTRILGWASSCTVQRGYQNIANPSLGYTSSGAEMNAVGTSNNQVVSLGDGGMATLQFTVPIADGTGADFAIYENGFIYALDTTLAYLELAKVSVSSDGIHFITFPSVDMYNDSAQLTNANAMDARLIHNLAGKYIAGQGTPFDLAELVDSPMLDISRVTHIRVTDVVGSLNDSFASYDSRGQKINDPFTTPFPSGGFDLESVAVLHQSGPSALTPIANKSGLKVFPNPANDFVQLPKLKGTIRIYNVVGGLVWSGNSCLLDIINWKDGEYFIKASEYKSVFVVRH